MTAWLKEGTGTTEKDKKQARETLYTLILGTVVSGIIFGVLGVLIFADTRASFAFGTFVGMVTACSIAVHLYKTIDKALDMAADAAVGYTRRMALLRLGLMGIPVVLALLFPEYLHVLGVFVGLLGLKIGAFLQPGLFKLYKKGSRSVAVRGKRR